MLRILILAILMASPAHADFFPIRDADWDRLPNTWTHYQSASAKALRRADPEDAALLREVMEGRSAIPNYAGTWVCRSIILGAGPLPMSVDLPQTCTITQTATSSWFLEVQTGTNRTRGVIRPDDGYHVYLGVNYFGERPAVDYQNFPDTQGMTADASQTRPAVGEVQQLSNDQIRILMPNPILGWDYQILYLTR